jgi:DNA invertase Pin-like site-specific DNA recombinase
MKKVFGYIRVSTLKQGEGVSLQEQKAAIIRYAEKNDLHIVQWFEELETAAKQGRPLFNKMINQLRNGMAEGSIIHKIDRSARNLKDWSLLGDLLDKGIEVHFAHESLDMDTRGGRLAADIQAVIASDYIRNLREEAIKGLYGRLKQGVYPFLAPIGYINNGGGKHKTIDPIKAPLVIKAFKLYATGNFTLHSLTNHMSELGLKNVGGNTISIKTMSKILKNPFYAGVLRVKGKTFEGGHTPLISSSLFSEVRNILSGKGNSKKIKHDFVYKKLLKCSSCGYSLIGEKQKGFVYYRCHTKNCITKSIKEDQIESFILNSIEKLQFYPLESQIIDELLNEAQLAWSYNEKGFEDSLRIQKEKISNKLERLTDAYIESIIDKETFDRKKEIFMLDMKALSHKSTEFSIQKEAIFKKAKNFLEHIKSIKLTYLSGIDDEKRRFLKTITSNLVIQGKTITIAMKNPFNHLVKRPHLSTCAHEWNRPRTCTAEYTTMATSVDNSDPTPSLTYVADLAINPVTKEVDFSNSVPILPQMKDTPELRENMKQLLDIILGFFEQEMRLLHSGDLNEEDELLLPAISQEQNA